MPAPPIIQQLVDRFALHRESYLAPTFNETQVRREFVDPFFKALGWDVDNERGYAESYKEVVHEDSLRMGATTKSPDYCFRIGGIRKFFVETKRLSVNVKADAGPAYQLRRYAWTAKLPLGVVTDFEEFAVYDCLSHRPSQHDKASKGRVLYLTFDEYVGRWDEIEGLLARESILRGSFERFVDPRAGRRGPAEVDVEFLREIEEWRHVLARNVALRNPDVTQGELNVVVQRVIDRIVFLRICEDRGIERPGRLRTLTDGSGIYERLGVLFREADDRFNSGLFHFADEAGRTEPPDVLTPEIVIDDAPLRQIIRGLYYPDSPYEFSVLPADILGQVYEQFLGKVIRLTAGHQAKVEEKPEVRKSGGVFYTPNWVVRHIVAETVGETLARMSPGQAAKVRILDPACGSGSFLIEAYQAVLDWHLDAYLARGVQRHRRQLSQSAKGEWRLATAERKRILLNNIFGVDIDPQAVEVTKLSLLLKVLEGESGETLERQLRLFQERALPDLGANIKCGNSLVGPDWFDGRNPELMDEEAARRIDAFDWNSEFPAIMRSGGFDVVIGNPPYVRMESFKELKDYLRRSYVSHAERTDLYAYFLEREHALLRDNGRLGMIVSNKFLRAKYGAPLRDHILEVADVERIIDLAGLPVFRGATVRTVILQTRKRGANGRRRPPLRYSPPMGLREFQSVETGTVTLAAATRLGGWSVARRQLAAEGWSLLRPDCAALMGKVRQTEAPRLREYSGDRICRGIVSGLNEPFVITPEQRRAILKANPAAKEIIQPFLQGRQVRRYEIEPASQYLIYTHHGIDMTPYPAVLEHLRPFRDRLRQRATQQAWYELQQPQFAYVSYLKQPKIVFPDMATGCRFALDTKGRFGANTVYFIPGADKGLLALLNSRLAHFFFQQTCAALEGPGDSYLRFFGQYLEGFPVRLPAAGSDERQRLEALADRVVELTANLSAVRVEHDRATTVRLRDVSEKQINDIVDALYGVSQDDARLMDAMVARATSDDDAERFAPDGIEEAGNEE